MEDRELDSSRRFDGEMVEIAGMAEIMADMSLQVYYVHSTLSFPVLLRNNVSSYTRRQFAVDSSEIAI